jgi:hypothetical protein
MVEKAGRLIARGFGLMAASGWLSTFAGTSEEAEPESSVDMRRKLSVSSSVCLICATTVRTFNVHVQRMNVSPSILGIKLKL